jgi:hypothetical protein
MLEVAVIPAKAGIHSVNLGNRAVFRLDSRFRGNDHSRDEHPEYRHSGFRGNDRCVAGDAIPSDTTTQGNASGYFKWEKRV